MPPLLDPGEALRPSHNDRRMLPSAVSTASASSMWSLRGSITAACTLAVYASQHRSPGRHARLASGWWLGPLPGGISPPGPLRKVSVLTYLILPPPQDFPGALRPDPRNTTPGIRSTLELVHPSARWRPEPRRARGRSGHRASSGARLGSRRSSPGKKWGPLCDPWQVRPAARIGATASRAGSSRLGAEENMEHGQL
jgi:hypothetical protein